MDSIPSSRIFKLLRKSFSPLTLLGCLLLAVSVQPVRAQQAETLFDGIESHGGFGGPMVAFGSIGGELSTWVGGRGGWLLNLGEGHAVSLGGGGFGLVSRHRVPDPDFGKPGVDYYAQTGYGGFEIEYYNRTHRLVHFTLSAMIGVGGIGISRDIEDEEVYGDDQSYFLSEPSANLELNVASFFRLAAGIGYRLTSGIDNAGFDDGHFSGLTGKLTLKFGAF